MAADKIRNFNKIKIWIILIWAIYPAVYFSKYNEHLPHYYNANNKINKTPNQSNKILLIGGSNAAMGLSAKIISTNLIQCYNFALNAEGGEGFSEYIDFIKNRITSSDLIVYSPFLVWSEQPSITKVKFINHLNFIPDHSILNQIKGTFFPKSSTTIEYDSFGDLVEYNCGYNFRGYSMDYQKFVHNNNLIVEEIIARVEKIKFLTRTHKVIIRIPPIYAHESRKRLIYEKMMCRIRSLKDAGIIVVGETICSSDKSLFCDYIHPNDKGRKLFSMELTAAIVKLKLVK